MSPLNIEANPQLLINSIGVAAVYGLFGLVHLVLEIINK